MINRNQARNLTKVVVGTVVAVGTGLVAGNALAKVIPSDTGLLAKVCVSVGVVAMQSVIVYQTTKHVDEQLDDIFDLIDELDFDTIQLPTFRKTVVI